MSLPRAKLTTLTGRRFGRLLVLGEGDEQLRSTHNSSVYGDPQRRVWVCACDCGGFVVRQTYRLSSGHVLSCGCLKGSAPQKTALDGRMRRKPNTVVTPRQPDALDFFFRKPEKQDE